MQNLAFFKTNPFIYICVQRNGSILTNIFDLDSSSSKKVTQQSHSEWYVTKFRAMIECDPHSWNAILEQLIILLLRTIARYSLKQKRHSMKQAQLGDRGEFRQPISWAVEAFYVIAMLIAKVHEEYWRVSLKTTSTSCSMLLVLGKDRVNKLSPISLSNDTIKTSKIRFSTK